MISRPPAPFRILWMSAKLARRPAKYTWRKKILNGKEKNPIWIVSLWSSRELTMEAESERTETYLEIRMILKFCGGTNRIFEKEKFSEPSQEPSAPFWHSMQCLRALIIHPERASCAILSDSCKLVELEPWRAWTELVPKILKRVGPNISEPRFQ